MTAENSEPGTPPANDQSQPTAKTEAQPNQWGLLNDYLKTVITLGGVLLGVAVAFVGRPLGGPATFWENGLLVGVLLFLFLAIVLALFGAASLVGYIRELALGQSAGRRHRASILAANTAFISLGLAGLCLFALGAVRTFGADEPPAAGDVMADVYDALEATVSQQPTDFKLLSYEADVPVADMVTIEVVEGNSAQEYVVVYSEADQSIRSLAQKP
jgi:hypothetical protein